VRRDRRDPERAERRDCARQAARAEQGERRGELGRRGAHFGWLDGWLMGVVEGGVRWWDGVLGEKDWLVSWELDSVVVCQLDKYLN